MPTGDFGPMTANYYSNCRKCKKPVPAYSPVCGLFLCEACASENECDDTVFNTKCKDCGKVIHASAPDLLCWSCAVKPSVAKIVDDVWKTELKNITPMECSSDEDGSIELDDILEHLKTDDLRKETLVVNMFAGPGCGKSTIAAGLFSELKWKKVECELALEYAKDLVWEKRDKTFEDQIYLFGKQHHRIHRLLGQVDVIITDCPILLSPIYDKEQRPTFEKLVVEEHNKMWTYNVVLRRKKTFNPKGRLHNEKEAKDLDRAITNLLFKHDQVFEVFDGAPESVDLIVRKILMLIKWKKDNEN